MPLDVVVSEKSVYPRYSLIMNKDQFLELLSQSGFPDPIEVQQAPNGGLDRHTHPFAVRALVLEGDIEIETDEGTRRYLAGDVFELRYEQPHTETYGSLGVKYLASRKQ